MIVPDFWAEARAQHRSKNRQITVRRFGWSNESLADAERMAQERVNEALSRLIAGESLRRSERRVPYNGADGIPIREEVIERIGDTVITRNSYGALCLNTPNVLFGDIDFRKDPSLISLLFLTLVAASIGVAAGMTTLSWLIGVVVAVVGIVLVYPVGVAFRRIFQQLSGGEEDGVRKRLNKFVDQNRDWHLRLYRTPAGIRVLVMHKTFEPRSPEVEEFFRQIRADKMYVRMCRNQNCFRARVSPKPWRIGMESSIRLSRRVWPIDDEQLPARLEWVSEYEKLSSAFAACCYIDSLGSSHIAIEARDVQELHDHLCHATSGRTLA